MKNFNYGLVLAIVFSLAVLLMMLVLAMTGGAMP